MVMTHEVITLRWVAKYEVCMVVCVMMGWDGKERGGQNKDKEFLIMIVTTHTHTHTLALAPSSIHIYIYIYIVCLNMS